MQQFGIGKVVKFIPLVLLGIAVASFVIMKLWNWIVPDVFGWHALTYGKAIGLLVLSRILFGRMGGPHGGMGRERLADRWMSMTPEERDRFREGMRGLGWGRGRAEQATDTET